MEEKMHTMKQGVSEFKNVCTTKLWANVCGNDVVFDWPIMHVLNQGKNVKSIDANKLKECERLLKNIVIHRIKDYNTERNTSFRNVIE